MQKIADDFQVRPAQSVEVDEFAQPGEVRAPRIDLLELIAPAVGGPSGTPWGGARDHPRAPPLDVASHFGQGRPAIGAGKLQSMIFRWIVARSEVDRAVRLAPKDFAGDRRGWCSGFAQQNLNAMCVQHLRSRAGELF